MHIPMSIILKPLTCLTHRPAERSYRRHVETASNETEHLVKYDGTQAPDTTPLHHVHGHHEHVRLANDLVILLQRSPRHHLARSEARVVVALGMAQGFDARRKDALHLTIGEQNC